MSWLDYFHPLKKLEKERIQSLKQKTLPDFAKALIAQPLPGIEDEANKQDYVCVDFETTGFDPKKDKILSIGWVLIKGLRIDLASSTHLMINESAEVQAQTAVINHITPEMLASGVSLDIAIQEFFEHCKGKIIVVHGGHIEKSFIHHFLQQRYGIQKLPMLWIDTLGIERHLSQVIEKSENTDLRLFFIRKRYGLPEYNAHNALVDSVATAELLLAQMKRVYKDGKTCFGRLYRISLS